MTDTAGSNAPVMPPGRELDALVAEKVMGWKPSLFSNFPWQLVPPDTDGSFVRQVPHYSTSWDAMRLVVERMVALGWDVDTSVGPDSDAVCGLHNDERDSVQAIGKTLPHAVCLAALAAFKAVTSAQQGAETSRE